MAAGKIALGLIAAVLLASFAQLYSQPQVAAPAERLTEAAQRLQELAHCRNQVLQGVVQNRSALAEVLSLTSTGDNYLALARQALSAGNASQAFSYAISALRTYGRVLELQEGLRGLVNASFASCGAVLAPELENVTAKLGRVAAENRTCRWSPSFYPLMVAINVSLQRVSTLESIALKASESGYDVSNATRLLSQARELLASAQSLAVECLTDEAARKLAEANKLIGLASAELAKAGARRLVAEMRAYGLEVSKVGEVLEALRGRRFEEYLVNRTLDALLNITRGVQELERERVRLQQLERLLSRIQERVQGELKQLALRVRELVREAIALAEKAPEIAKSSPGEAAKQAQEIARQAQEIGRQARRGGG